MTTLPFAVAPYGDLLRLTKSLIHHTPEERRTILFDGWYEAALRIDAVLPERVAVDIILKTPAARDIAVLGSTLLQPRDCRIFDGFDAYARRQRAILIRDSRAVNAAPGASPQAAPYLVIADPAAEPPLRLRR